MELRTEEKVIEQVRGDYWGKIGFVSSRYQGKIFFTNQRIHAEVGLTKEFDIEYGQIKSVEKCNVGALIKYMPVGIRVETQEGETYVLAVLNREKYIKMIEANK